MFASQLGHSYTFCNEEKRRRNQMRSVGIIVEYNPFHNGHFYHLQEAKKVANASVVIAVMSGYFLQRGEPALVSKWDRAKMALAGGADLVFELPYAYSTQKAELFAYGAVNMLHSLSVNELCFGSESGTIEEFHTLVEFLHQHKNTYNSYIKQYMKEGNSYPKATSLAFQALSPDATILDLSKPNNILGFHYIDAILQLKSPIVARTIYRKAANYHDETFASSTIASATSIRKTLQQNEKDLLPIQKVVPSSTYTILTDYIQANERVHDWESYFPYLKYRIMTMSEKELQNIYESEEGIEYRLKKYSTSANTFSEFMELIKTKRYTWNRLQRYCLHILTNTTKVKMTSITNEKDVPYLRLLGMTKEGQSYLNHIKKDLLVPIVTKPKEINHPCLMLDQQAALAYSFGYPTHLQNKKVRDEYQTPPIKYNKKTGSFH